mmetsp:Transcript_18006/g.50020  ORF Transcript_18006/g.50020 Transcript_18006/m.50020 type:complete len:201 (+) Transcript_18006:851-1453(+)
MGRGELLRSTEDPLHQGLEELVVLEGLGRVSPCDGRHLLRGERRGGVLDPFGHHEEPEFIHRQSLRGQGDDERRDLSRCELGHALAHEVRKQLNQLCTRRCFNRFKTASSSDTCVHSVFPAALLEDPGNLRASKLLLQSLDLGPMPAQAMAHALRLQHSDDILGARRPHRSTDALRIKPQPRCRWRRRRKRRRRWRWRWG